MDDQNKYSYIITQLPHITKGILEKWEQYHNATDIAKDLQLSQYMITRRLKICTKLGLINYDPVKQINAKKRKSVYDIHGDTQYESISACARALNVSRAYVTQHTERFIINQNNTSGVNN